MVQVDRETLDDFAKETGFPRSEAQEFLSQTLQGLEDVKHGRVCRFDKNHGFHLGSIIGTLYVGSSNSSKWPIPICIKSETDGFRELMFNGELDLNSAGHNVKYDLYEMFLSASREHESTPYKEVLVDIETGQEIGIGYKHRIKI